MHKGFTIGVFLLLAGLASIAAGRAAQLPAGRVVIIDPAHGGKDKGVVLSGGEAEKDITLKIALALQKELNSAGKMHVILTRLSDVDMTVAQRIKVVRDARSDLFLSLHINAGFGKTAAGYEVYFPGFTASQGKKGGAAEILTDMTKNKYLNDSVALAQSIMRNLQKVFPRGGRGLRDAPVPVLEGLTLPAVVVEVGFATNASDGKVITDEKGQRAVAQALGRGINDYINKVE